LRAVNVSIHINVVSDGIEALAFLKKQDKHAHAPRPTLILLDLHLPRMGGWEVLASIKRDEGLRAIPTIVLSASDRDIDIHMAHVLQANCFLTKPGRPDELDRIISLIHEFWLRVLEVPTESES
jgi:CheY-like chemotaxis protein